MTNGVERTTERDMVLEYVIQRSISAFNEGDDEQAFTMHRMAESIESMSVSEFANAYPVPAGGIA